MTLRRPVVQIFLATLLILPACASADGFGWYGRPFRYEALPEIFGGAVGTSVRASGIKTGMEKIFNEELEDKDAAELSLTLSSMLKLGWRSTKNKRANANKWAVFGYMAVNPHIVPELRFEEETEMIEPVILLEALQLSTAKPSVLRHFQRFGREIDAAEGYLRCSDTVADFSAGYEPRIGECGPYDMILSPPEVEALYLELQAVRQRMSPSQVSRLTTLLNVVSSARSIKRGIYFRAFN